jgi:SRSO17 transposase
LYLPKEWTGDVARWKAAGVAPDAAFTTKPALGRQMLQRAVDAGVTARWVLGDELYGGDYTLRAARAERWQRYVLGVAATQDGWAGV